MKIVESPRALRPVGNWVRWALLVTWFVMVLLIVLSGEREGRFSNLEKDLASGRVTEVTVRGYRLPDSPQIEQTVRWRDGLFLRTDTVLAYSGEDRPAFQGPVLQSQDVVTYLRQTYPGATVKSEGERQATSDIFGFDSMNPVLGIMYVVVHFGTLVRIIAGPEPWRATRWAWFWVWCLLAPVAPPLFLALSGPTPLVPAPKDLNRRLTGGVALLVAVVISLISKGTIVSS
ncbi:hypothetical protein [Kineosporia sp. NBRC 101731]|uniref:hypothetical protein n=1 Tax=Kineosporia sp. NBRC 101731 TaxID=3032199 RepID=UPI0024A37CC1|nr:hypothetical protein [Kineosporia sp. NBRC 101731]GLY28177.1 hypothetical protein Kisp02_15420 [Kineosporia sp. NBRC 101731]